MRGTRPAHERPLVAQQEIKPAVLATSRRIEADGDSKEALDKTNLAKASEVYKHPEAELLLRPEAGTQAQFRKKKLPKKYRYDDSLSPTMEWDGQNAARVVGEWLLQMSDEASRLGSTAAYFR